MSICANTTTICPQGYILADQQNDDTSSVTSSESSQESIFSDNSDASSQSSQGDSDREAAIGGNIMHTKEFDALSKRAFTFPQPVADPIGQSHVTVCSTQRQHPRRSSSLRAPPPLPRQEERKVLFVNDLVDSATAMVEAIWPLSSSACTQSNGRGILPLRRYIEETLRRSRTSYSTLQVALYYLVLIKSHVPRHDFTMEQPADSASLRSMQCGRRMFLAALILASKYLQDRNYSAKAWSKMSGLKTSEINSNERMFLSAVNWKLHITDQVFKRWTDVVLRFTAPSNPPSAGQAMAIDTKTLWKRVMPLLTPDLDDPRVCSGVVEAEATAPNQASSFVPRALTHVAPKPAFAPYSLQTSTPTSSFTPPRFLEPKPDLPQTPGLARMGPLPTPQMTPSSVASNTPAVSACSSRRPSICSMMSQVQTTPFCRMTIDRFPGRTYSDRSLSGFSSKAPSLVSSGSSPDSVLSDCPRSSRSSSISSVSTTLTGALGQAFAARLATRQVNGSMRNAGDAAQEPSDSARDLPVRILDDVDMSMSPSFATFNIQDDVTSKAPQLTSSLSCRKRGRSGHESDLQANVRSMLSNDTTRGHVEADQVTVDRSVILEAIGQSPRSTHRSRSASSLKSAQPPCSLRRENAQRLPICHDSGRKRTCFSVEQIRPSQEKEKLFMEIST